MKLRTKIWFIIFLTTGFSPSAQNVGINTNNPLATLDIRGNTRFGGLTNYISYDSLSGKINWNNSKLFVPTSQQLIQHSNSAEGLFYNNSSLEYRNQIGNPVFSTNWNTGNSFFAGSVGIGTLNPGARLHVLQDTSGVAPNTSNLIVENKGNNYISFFTPDNFESAIVFDKASQLNSGRIGYNNPAAPDGIIFRNNNANRLMIRNNGYVAIGNQLPPTKFYIFDGASGYSGGYFPGLTLEGSSNRYIDIIGGPNALNGIGFRRSDTAEAGIIYNSSASPNGIQFRSNKHRTRMLLLSNGFLGIGNNNPSYVQPAYILDVTERMRIRSGGNDFLSAGIWLNNNSNTEEAFLGMENDNHIGLYGSGSSWKFSMNTNTGALKVNGSEGFPGQAITSGGSGTADWKSVTNSIYSQSVMKLQNTQMSTTQAGGLTQIPDLIHTFTVTGNAKVILTMTLNAYAYSCSFCGSSRLYVEVQLDGVAVKDILSEIPNGRDRIIADDLVFSVTPGTHTVRLVTLSIGPDVRIYDLSCFKSNMILEIIPE